MKKLMTLAVVLAVVGCKKDDAGSRDTDASARADSGVADVREAGRDADSAMNRAGAKSDSALDRAGDRMGNAANRT
ncbi:MAG: hypothetical protein H0W67_07495, partial [Gemmatimonadales bacterium]|nr:hypothetical protein [Gemmatimonadales bacterium]